MSKGYHILERNFRCRQGEIDLVAEDEQDLIFVEVKARRDAQRLRHPPERTRHQRAGYRLDQLRGTCVRGTSAGVYSPQSARTTGVWLRDSDAY